MITVISKLIKTIFTQSTYDDFIKSINISTVTCPKCGHTGYLVFYGFYPRRVVFNDKIDTIHVQRVMCQYCHRTHALFPDCIVPYNPVLLNDQVSLICELEDTDSCESFQTEFPHVPDSLIDRIYNGFKSHWKQRMLSEYMNFDMKLYDLIISAFSHYRMQFLQIHHGLNGLILPST